MVIRAPSGQDSRLVIADPGHDRYEEYTTEELKWHLSTFPRHADRKIVLSRLQHRQTMRRAGWTLFWAVVGGIAGAIATLVLLFHDTPLSKLLPAMSSQSTPAPAPTSAATASPLPTPELAASATETPQATSTPSKAETSK